MALIIIAITSCGKALENETRAIELSGHSLDQLISGNSHFDQKSNLTNYEYAEQQIIDLYREEIPHNYSSYEDAYLDSYLNTETLVPITIFQNTNTNLQYINDNSVWNSYNTNDARIASNDVASDVGSNLDHLYNLNGEENNQDELNIIGNSDTPNIIYSNLNDIYKIYNKDNYILMDDRIANSSIASNVDSGQTYTYENQAKNIVSDSNGITNTIFASEVLSNLNYLYERKTNIDDITDSNKLISLKTRLHRPPGYDVLYENMNTNNTYDSDLKKMRIASSDPASEIGSNLNYIFAKYSTRIAKPDIISNIDANINYLYDQRSDPGEIPVGPILSQSSIDADQYSISDNMKTLTEINYHPLVDPNAYYPVLFPESLPLATEKKASKVNYAIVIGIEGYADRTALHTSIADANAFAALLECYGYKVTKMTDETPLIPTKRNIEAAIADLENMKNRGNVIFYFSGHGEIDKDGNYYLLPQDANGAESTYISRNELSNYIQDIKNMAMIIDACNSGALCDLAGQDQLVLASSKPEEPSNEEWMGSQSVFTKNLCDAIRKEMQLNSRITLQNCFVEAQRNTIRWGNTHFLSQTPILTDMTSGRFYLN
jgi:hypothetical protein